MSKYCQIKEYTEGRGEKRNANRVFMGKPGRIRELGTLDIG
jgi:hypothetical protein